MKKNLDFLFYGTYVIFPLSDLFIEVIQLQFKTQINSQIENVRVKKRIIFSLLAIILIFMFLFLIYENFRMEKEIDRVVGMRARVMKDYIRKVGSQTRALGLSITDYLTFYENTPINPDLIKRFKNYPNLNRFGIPHISRENQEGSGPRAL